MSTQITHDIYISPRSLYQQFTAQKNDSLHVVTGVYWGKHETPWDGKAHMFIRGDDTLGVYSTAVLDRLFKNIGNGEKVSLSYFGMKTSRQGYRVHEFKVRRIKEGKKKRRGRGKKRAGAKGAAP